VYVEGPHNKHRVKLKACLTEAVDPRVVHAPSHWYFPELAGKPEALEANINWIMSNDPPYDPVCGATPLRGGLCRVSRAGG